MPPAAPVTALPESVLAEFRAEITAEFEAYFAELSSYIACLDEERDRAITEASAATQDYARFLHTHPTVKDIP